MEDFCPIFNFFYSCIVILLSLNTWKVDVRILEECCFIVE